MRRRALLVAGFVAAAAAPLACRKRRRAPRFAGTSPPSAGGIRFVYEIDFARAWEPERGREAVLARTVEVLRRRVAGLTEGGVVRPPASGSGVEVFLPGGPSAMYEAWRHVARLPARFQVQRVDDGSAFMTALAKRLGADVPAGVDVREDYWTQGGADHADPYLSAADRQRLIDLLAKDAAGNPLPFDRTILLERQNAVEAEPSRWRTYYVEKDGGIDNADIADAEVGAGFDGRPELQIVLTAAGRRKFAELTRRSVGHKIAVVLEGQIETAPVVMEPIPGGRVHVTTGRGPSPTAVREDLEDLAAALRSGPLPAPLMFTIQEQVPRLP